jgi:predicted permease
VNWRELWRPGRRPGAVERDVDRELRDHLDLEAEEQERDGLAPAAARRSARLLFGNPFTLREDVRAVSRWPWWERLKQDGWYTLRAFRRSPAFTTTAVLSLALAIGANTAMFTLVDAALLRPLPVTRPDELALIDTPDNFSFPTYRMLAGRTRSLTHLLAASATMRVAVDLGEDREPTEVKIVSGNYFEALGVVPAAGRLFTAPEEIEPLAVLGHAFWRSRLGAAPEVVGRLIPIGGVPFRVVGVASPGFFGESTGEAPGIWTTMALQPPSSRNEPGFTWLRLIGRLGPGVTLQQSEAELRAVAESLPIAVSPGRLGTSGLRQQFAFPLAVMFGLVVLVLLIACTNLASLLLTRGAARGSEIAIRLALGASRRRVVRQLMTENLLMAAIGAGLGLALSFAGTRVLLRLVAGAGQTVALDVRHDVRVLLFAGAVTVVATVLFGLAPALRTVKTRAAGALLNRTRSVAGADRRWTLREAFIIVQVALSLILLACGAMLVRTVISLQGQDLGMRTENLLVASLNSDRGYRPDLSVVLRPLLERVRALPGVETASAAAFGTLGNQGGVYGLEVDGYTPQTEQDRRARADYVGPDYFRTAGISLIAGREFSWADQARSPRVAIVNQTMARFYFGEESVVGRRFRFNKNEHHIVGVVNDAKYNDLRETTTPRYVYFAALQAGPGVRTLEIRTVTDALLSVAALRPLVRDVDPRLSIGDVQTMRERIDEKTGRERMVASLASFFGVLTLLLASTGIYGTLAYTAGLRTREIGLRLALGARRTAVVWIVVRHTVAQLAAGVLLGVFGAIAVGRGLVSLLFGVTPGDPLTIGIAAGMLAIVALLAVSIPAVRAARLNPASVLAE